jgi:hypothetical protein
MSDRTVDVQEMVLAIYLGNAATNSQWFEQLVKVTPPKTDKKTGELKPGVSERTFNRQRKAIVERGHAAVSGTGNGKIYSIVAGPWAGKVPLALNAEVQVARPSNGGGDFPDCRTLSEAAKTIPSSSDDLIAQALRQARLRNQLG